MNKVLRLSLLRHSLGITNILRRQRPSFEKLISVEIIDRKLMTTPLCNGKIRKIKNEKDNKMIKEKIAVIQEQLNDEEEEIDDGLPKDYTEKKFHTTSRRIDSILHRVLGRSNTEVEKMIFTSKVRINDGKINKKAYNVDKGDQIDVFLSTYPDNDRLIYISRIILKHYEIKENGYNITVKFWKKMLVENWKS
uniref:S4 RNA-binding domain-containing protein n=1 Tax=Strongyloides venezuelensis TaxID=75913 RepID=A0A0K0G3W2_STRVS